MKNSLIRASLCLVLVLLSTLANAPAVPRQALDIQLSSSPRQISAPYAHDPNGTLAAFNATYAQFDLYRNNTAVVGNSTNLRWFSTLNSTQSGQPIPGTAFNYTIASNPGSIVRENVTWKLTVPRGVSNTTFLRFSWNGTSGLGTFARYQLYNESTPIIGIGATKTNTTFLGGPPRDATGGIPLPCGTNYECYNITKYTGFSLALTFTFNSTATGNRLTVQVVNVEVASVRTAPVLARSHSMTLISSTDVLHIAKILVTYNSTVSYRNLHNATQPFVHVWNNTILNLFLPKPYRLDNATLNPSTPCTSPCIQILPTNRTFSTGPCVSQGTLTCTNSVYYSLNMTSPNDRVANATSLIYVRTDNAIASVTPTLGGIDNSFWTATENMTLKVINQPAVFSVAGSQNVWFTDPTGVGPVSNSTQSFSARNGTSIYSVKLPSSPLGIWTVTTNFLSGYDYGALSRTFRIDRILLSSFSVTGGAGNKTPLNARGVLKYGNMSSFAGNVNATVFAIDEGSPPAPISTNGTALSSGMFITNITLVNGVFNRTFPLTALFSIKNPTAKQFTANITIEHEWCSGCTHGVNVTFSLDTLGDEPYLFTPVTYRALISLTINGIQVEVRSLQTNSKVILNLSPGIGSSVPPSRQHFGLFKLTIRSRATNSTQVFTQSVESPPYAYVVSSSLVPSRLLAFSNTVTTLSADGSFSATITSDKVLAASRLVLLVLARDINGIVLAPDPVGASDNTILLPSADIPGEVTINQSVQVTVHLKNNSTRLTMNLTVNLDLSGPASIPTQTKPIVIAPGDTGSLTFTLKAPSTAGPYVVIFSSKEYGAPILTKDLRVSLVQSSLQILVPALIGLVAALVIVGAYMVRRKPVSEEPEEKPKPSGGKPSKPQPGALGSKPLTRSQTL